MDLDAGAYDITVVILTGKIAVCTLIIGNGVAGSRTLYAGDFKIESFLVAVGIGVGKIGLAVRGIISTVLEALSGGVELNNVAYAVSIGGLVAVGRNDRVAERPLVAVFNANILAGSGHVNVLSGRVGNLETAGDTGGDIIGYRLKRIHKLCCITCIIGVGLAGLI